MATEIDVLTNPFFHYDMDKICAICNRKLYKEKHSIFSYIPGKPMKVSVVEELESICDYKFQDGPRHICTSCHHNTLAVHKFRSLCNTSHENLRNFLMHQEAMKKLKKKKALTEPPLQLEVKQEEVKFEHVEVDNIMFHDLEGKIDLSNVTPEIDEDLIIMQVQTEEENAEGNNEADTNAEVEKVENESETEEIMGDVMKSTITRRMMCKVCHKTFRADYFNVHMRTHTGEKPYQCDKCPRAFSTSTSLKLHSKSHSEKRDFVCEFCGAGFKLLATLKIHERQHTGERPFPCSICDMSFPSSSRRKQHQIVHTGLKDFQCELCAKSFTRLTVLRDHLKAHAGIKDFACEMCGKRFTQKHTLRSHEADRCKVKKKLIETADVSMPLEVYVIEQEDNE